MQRPLSEIAEIQVGLTLRGTDASRRTVEEGLHMLRISDITENGVINVASEHLLSSKTDRRYIAEPDDIIVVSRGSRATAALIPQEQKFIAGSQFFILKINKSTLEPAYLAWYLNLNRTQERLANMMRGSQIKTLPVAAIRQLEIPIPNRETQQRIISLADLAARESALTEKLLRSRKNLVESGLFKIISFK